MLSEQTLHSLDNNYVRHKLCTNLYQQDLLQCCKFPVDKHTKLQTAFLLDNSILQDKLSFDLKKLEDNSSRVCMVGNLVVTLLLCKASKFQLNIE